MVNLPPDSNEPRRPLGGAPSQGSRLLDFDELLAVVLAFVGIGSILWWGLSRSQGWVANSSLLQRQARDAGAIAADNEDQPAGLFEPRQLEPQDAPERIAAAPEVERGSQPVRPTEPRVTAPTATAPQALPAETAATQPIDIADVPTTHWAYPFILPMFEAGYLPDFPESGFQPDQPLTRAELAALLSQAFGNAPREGSVRTFSDVPGTYWAAAAIDNAVAQGFMNGYPEGDFRPDQAVPRYEVLVSLATGLGLANPPAPDQTLQAFIDTAPLPDWARPKVAAAADRGLIVNYPNRDQLKPAQAATRAEIVAMIHQALVQEGQLPAVESEYTVP